MFKRLTILFALFCVVLTSGQKSLLFESRIKSFITDIYNNLSPILTKLETKSDLSVNCSYSLRYTLENAVQLKWWALQMLDSSGHFPIGLIEGTFGSIGDFHECLDIDPGSDAVIPFIGQYCSPRFRLPFELDGEYPEDTFFNRTLSILRQFHTPILTNAFCIPSTCSPHEFKAILNEIFSPFHIETYLDANDCYHKREVIQMSSSQTILLYFISSLVILLFLSTFADLKIRSDEQMKKLGKISFLIKSFSLTRNWKTFFSTTDETNENQLLDLKIFDFFKLFVLIYVISSHIFLNGLLSYQLIAYKYRQVLEMGKDFHSQIMSNSAVFIELVFYMSGTLTVISGLKYFRNGRRPPFALFIFSRYIRVIPVQLITIGMTVLFALLGTGPAFKTYYNKQISNCDNNLWKNLLFVANYDKYPETCAGQTWFISADIQLFILSYFSLKLLATKPKIGLMYSSFFVVLGMAIPGALTLLYNMPPPIIRVKNQGLAIEEDLIHITHSSTYTHLTEYFMGIITGYIILTNKNINLTISTQNILSVCSVILSISCIFSTYLLNGLEWQGLELFYTAFMRFFFTLAICWMTIVLARGNKGPFQIFNALSNWSNKKISKLCFSATLINIELIRFIKLSSTTISDRNMLFMLVTIIGFVIISLFVGFIIHLTVEMPFNNLCIYLLKSKIKQEPKIKKSD